MNGLVLAVLCFALLVSGCEMQTPGSATAFVRAGLKVVQNMSLPLDIREAIDALPGQGDPGPPG